MTNKKVLSIAGSDPSGGAGIQADIKTFTALGVYGSAVVTCLTVQNTEKVTDVFYLSGDFVKKQAEAVLSDIDISYIKIGMLGNIDIIKAVGELIDNYYVILDPVMISKSGYPLMEEAVIPVYEDLIIRKSSIITPNYYELIKLSGNSAEDPVKAGEGLMQKYPLLKAVLVKGGHIGEIGNNVTDTLIYKENGQNNTINFKHKRYHTKNTHGTGCTLSSAITAFLAKNYDIVQSVRLAVDYVTELISISSDYPVGRGNGPLPHHILLGVNK